MPMPFTLDELEHHIKVNKESSSQLYTVLLEEQEALKSRKPELIEKLLEKKTSLLLQLEESANIRSAWAHSISQNPLEQSWDQILKDAQKPALQEEWNELKTITQNCKRQNEINGKLLANGKKALGRVLDVFRGKTSNPSLYNAYGSSASQSQTHKVGEA